MTNKRIREVFDEIFLEEDYSETSRLHSPEFFETNTLVQHLVIYGGMNGLGSSKDYLYDLYELIDALEMFGVLAYIVKMDVDALDDLFKVEFELRDLKEFYNEKPE